MVDLFKNSRLDLFSPNWIGSDNLNLHIKRDDLLHPEVSGNKGRKLYHFIKEYYNNNYKGILTYGGAFSNHLYAVASLTYALNIPSIGIVRGEELNSQSNETLKFCSKKGMNLQFIQRSLYRQFSQTDKYPKSFLKYKEKYLIIPEGGRGQLGQIGCMDIPKEINFLLDSDKPIYYFISVGTGTTALGVLRGLRAIDKLYIVPALKGDFIKIELLGQMNDLEKQQTIFLMDYHFGGYAKFNDTLINFINDFYSQTQIPLDPIYESKLLFAMKSEIEKNQFVNGDQIVAIHSGGMQGVKGFNDKYGQLIIT